jgi:inosine-uridine nucleoside N-ribohydrolase
MQFGRGGKPSAGAFFDSDFATVDSLLGLSILHGMQGKNDCRVAIVTMSRPNIAVAGLVDTVERFYRGPAGNFSQVPPVGMRVTGNPGETPAAFTAPFSKKKADGTPTYLNRVPTVTETGDPNTLFRNYLNSQYDQNAFFVLAGPATNLAAALQFRGMRDLIAAKIKYLVVAGGAFPAGPAETHIKADIAAAKKLFAEWPTPIVMSGNEIGTALEFPGASIDKEFAAAVPDNPVADAYRAWKPMPYNAPSWAMAASLYAGRPKEGYFKLSEPGSVTVRDDGQTAWTASATGKHQYLIADPAQQARIIQAYVDLASAKPVPPQRFRPPVVVDAEKPAEVENKVPQE